MEEDTMVTNDILSEKPEDTRETIKWSKELQVRREKSDLLTKELLKKFTPEVMRKLTAKSLAR